MFSHLKGLSFSVSFSFGLGLLLFEVHHLGHSLVGDGLLTFLKGSDVVVGVGLILFGGLKIHPFLVVWTYISHRDNDEVKHLISRS